MRTRPRGPQGLFGPTRDPPPQMLGNPPTLCTSMLNYAYEDTLSFLARFTEALRSQTFTFVKMARGTMILFFR